MLGDGKTMIALTGTVIGGNRAGQVYTLDSPGMVERPSSGTRTVGFGLWGNGMGRVSTTDADITTGWTDLTGLTTKTPFTADFMATVTEVDGKKSTASLGAVGVALTTANAGTKTVMGAVPGTKPDTGKTSVKDKNEGAGISNAYGYTVDKMHPGFKADMTTAEILSYSAKTTGKIAYCKQKVTQYDIQAASNGISGATYNLGLVDDPAAERQDYQDRDPLLHFVAITGNRVITVNSKLGGTISEQVFKGDSNDNSDADLAMNSDWLALAKWIAKWNIVFPSYAIMTRVAMDTNDTAATTDDVPYILPVVVCDTQSTTEQITVNHGMTISPSDTHCGSGKNQSVKLAIYAPAADARTRNPEVIPPIADNGKVGSTTVAATEMLTITCPASSASRGQELVPDNSWNPFQR